MSDLFYKFPSTPHLAWLADIPLRGDKLLNDPERDALLAGDIVVEEKLDGANLGISISDDGRIRLQNRGNYLHGSLQGQWSRLRSWLGEHEAQLCEFLPADHILFGEWCYARHSIAYDALPDWFLGFDIFDCTTERFWSSARRDALLRDMHLSSVPRLAQGVFTLEELKQILDQKSSFSSHLLEGIYVRKEDAEKLLTRAKLVRADFTQNISDHWTKGGVQENRMESSRTSKRGN